MSETKLIPFLKDDGNIIFRDEKGNLVNVGVSLTAQKTTRVSKTTKTAKATKATEIPFPLTENIREWLNNGERGVSSNTIIAHLCKLPGVLNNHFPSIPYDADDLKRCVKLIDACPELVPLMPYMVECDPWSQMAGVWDELVDTYRKEKEIGKGYKKTQEIIDSCKSYRTKH